MFVLAISAFILVICTPVSPFKEHWFTQQLDHFDDNNDRTWMQRYYYNFDFYRTGGPVFLYIEGETAARPSFLLGGQFAEMALEVGAAMYLVEHRFYGESKPTADTSVKNLRYLTSEQALADLAAFIRNKTAAYGRDTWVTFGGSYPGALSLWMRLKYPSLTRGAMSASAPLVAKVDYSGYNDIIERAILTVSGENCTKALATAVAKVQELLKTDTGRTELYTKFNLCEYLGERDYKTFQFAIHNRIAWIVQYNEIPTSEVNLTIPQLCQHMTNESLGDEVTRYATIPIHGLSEDNKKKNTLELETLLSLSDPKDCLHADYKMTIASLRVPRFNAQRTYFYQLCNEFGWFQTSDGVRQPFRGFSFDYFFDRCYMVFGRKFTSARIVRGIAKTNEIYGGRKIAENITNAYIFNGGIDPWHPLSYIGQSDHIQGYSPPGNPTFHALYDPESSHCAITNTDFPTDSDKLRESRKLAMKYLKSWIQYE